MKSFPTRKWLKSRGNVSISLSMKDVSRLGTDNTNKLLAIAKKNGLNATIQNQYSGIIGRTRKN